MAISQEENSIQLDSSANFPADPFPIDPDKVEYQRQVDAIKISVKRHNWEPPVFVPAEPVPTTATEESSNEDPTSIEAKFKATMLMLYTFLRRTGAMINNHVITPLRRGLYAVYNYAVQPSIDAIFGKLDYPEERSYSNDNFEIEVSVSSPRVVNLGTLDTADNQPTTVFFSSKACGCSTTKSGTYFSYEESVGSDKEKNATMSAPKPRITN